MRKFDYDFLIDGEPILISDAGVQITEKDIVETATDESGVTHRDVIRTGVMAFTIPYSRITRDELLYMRSLIRGKKHFAISYLNLEGQVATITAHCEKINTSMYNKATGVYKKFNLVISES